MSRVIAAVLVVSCNFIVLSSASEFLKTSPHEFIERVSEKDLRTSLLHEIESSLPDPLGTALASSRLAEIEGTLQPIYAALPKNEHGNLDHTIARYGLQRLFVLRHGWKISGLAPAGGTYSNSSPAGVLKGQVPSFVQDLFEKRLGGMGFRLHELAVLAVTIEHLIQEEAVSRLKSAFRIHDISSAGILSDADAKEMLDTYMMAYITSENLDTMTYDAAQKLVAELPEMFSYWTETQEFVHAVQKNVAPMSGKVSHLDFAALTRVAEVVGDQFGSFFHKTVCTSLKSSLMKMEHQNTGRVKLSEFYKPALGGFWQFQESVGYLRELGVLEETDPSAPSVLIANYMNSPSNCIASSGFYSACCKNECDDLLAHLEQDVACPEAAPATIATLVTNLSSSTVPAPRTLSDTLLRRLDEIAAHHGSMVPLHGRLFAQWMHLAFPRECSYPHLSGTTNPTLPDVWAQATGEETAASEEEMRQYVQWSDSASDADVSVEDIATWSSEEELLVVQPIGGASQLSQGATAQTSAGKRSMAVFMIVGCLAYALIQIMKSTPMGSYQPQKFAI